MRTIRRRTRRDPKPRFKADCTQQLDGVRGCPDAIVPDDHLARVVIREVARLDLSQVEASYSSLGRRGFSPRGLLGLWVYASLIGVHHASKLAKLTLTDAACRLLTGGHAVSRSKLGEFRAEHGELFQSAIEQTLRFAVEDGLLRSDECARMPRRRRCARSHARNSAWPSSRPWTPRAWTTLLARSTT